MPPIFYLHSVYLHKMAKTTQKRPFLSFAGHSGTDTRKIHTNYSLCTRSTYFWFMFKKSAQSARPKMLQPCEQNMGSVWSYNCFRAFDGVKVLRSRQIWYQNFGHLMGYKLYFDHFPPNPQRKKLFAKNTFFDHLKKHVFLE